MSALLSLRDTGSRSGTARDDEPTTEHRLRHLLRDRRVAVGREISLLFENRDTLRFRLQELGRVARLTSASHVRPELDWYTRLLSAAGTLRAALWVGEAGRRTTRATLDLRGAVTRGRVALEDATGRVVAGRFRRDRVQDRLIGLAGWVEFAFTPAEVEAFATPGRGWHVVVEASGGRDESAVLSDGVWRSLVADLT